jgi:RNA polymerase primary sigma factor
VDRELASQIARSLATLNPREQEILRLRFGLDQSGAHTLEEIGNRLAVTRERVRQIEVGALRKLRQPRRASGLRAFVG